MPKTRPRLPLPNRSQSKNMLPTKGRGSCSDSSRREAPVATAIARACIETP